jgi:hypothetical protein
MKEIGLTQGQITLVDDGDFEELSKYNWCAQRIKNKYYAVRQIWNGIDSDVVWMAQEIMDPSIGLEVDHINHDTLDNRRCNLRICTREQNSRNRLKSKGNYTSGFKGVHWNSKSNRWIAQIRWSGKSTHLGAFTDEVQAALAYDIFAVVVFGEFACTNFKEV